MSTHSYWTYPNQTYGGIPTLQERITLWKFAKKVGFEGIELATSWIDLLTLSEDKIADLKSEIDTEDLSVAAVNCLRSQLADPEEGKKNLEDMHKAIEIAERLNCSSVNISLSRVGPTPATASWGGRPISPGCRLLASEADIRLTTERLKILANYAARKGISIVIELHHQSVADTAKSLLELLDIVDEPNLSANPDLINGFRSYAIPPESWWVQLKMLLPRTSQLWHVKNACRMVLNPEQSCFVPAAMNQGDIDYRWALLLARQHGFEGWISIETTGRCDPFEYSKRSFEYIQDVIAFCTRDGSKLQVTS